MNQEIQNKKLQHQLWNKWSIYENYSTTDQKAAYTDALKKVCDFHSLEELAFIAKKTMYGKIDSIFTDPQGNGKARYFSVFDQEHPESQSGDDRQIIAIAVFKDDIFPSWEHPANAKAGEIKFELQPDSYDKMNEIFLELVYVLVGMEQEGTTRINGLRVVDKMIAKQKPHVRFEVWLDFDPLHKDEPLQKIKNHIDDILVKIQQDAGCTSMNIKLESHVQEDKGRRY